MVVVAMPEPVVEPDLDQQAEPVEFTTPEGLTIRFAEPEDGDEIVVPPPPCQQCGGFMGWWDVLPAGYIVWTAILRSAPHGSGSRRTGPAAGSIIETNPNYFGKIRGRNGRFG